MDRTRVFCRRTHVQMVVSPENLCWLTVCLVKAPRRRVGWGARPALSVA